MIDEKLNRKIHLWLGKCWHGPFQGTDLHYWICVKCKVEGPAFDSWSRKPNYARDPVAMAELIEAVRVKGYWWKLTTPFDDTDDYRAGICPKATTGWNGRADFLGEADTLPMAVALAVEKLIDAENLK